MRLLAIPFSLFFVLVVHPLDAQRFENVTTTFDGENVIIAYDLIFDHSSEPFTVTVYSSHDNYTIPMRGVKGDVGDRVLPGKGRVIVWDARNSLPTDFNDVVIVKLKGLSSAVPALVAESLPKAVYKKGEEVKVTWKGGGPADKVAIHLTKNNEVRKQLVEGVDNTSAYTWKIPNGILAGKHYGITVSRVSEPADLSTVQSFRIKARVPLWLKILPVVGAGAAAAIILKGEASGLEVLPRPEEYP